MTVPWRIRGGEEGKEGATTVQNLGKRGRRIKKRNGSTLFLPMTSMGAPPNLGVTMDHISRAPDNLCKQGILHIRSPGVDPRRAPKLGKLGTWAFDGVFVCVHGRFPSVGMGMGAQVCKSSHVTWWRSTPQPGQLAWLQAEPGGKLVYPCLDLTRDRVLVVKKDLLPWMGARSCGDDSSSPPRSPTGELESRGRHGGCGVHFEGAERTILFRFGAVPLPAAMRQ